ncbi:hypothetical protein [Bradyrhizobium sp. WSM2793]|nr:hypothetical protein [Bradyrhizobium sp. WSM2793]
MVLDFENQTVLSKCDMSMMQALRLVEEQLGRKAKIYSDNRPKELTAL